ncbi:hypothetical protein [Altererythrobacter sp. Z27]|uniref:hypothetical protein n=1 Tax=Altererythrobacter sp. Z27 TaxID=3461147 RepID=UPI0040440A34
MTPNKSDLMNAYDARLLMLEGRHEAARDRFREVIESVLDSEDVNAAYIERFCRFILALYEQDAKARAMKSEAMKLVAEKKCRRLLPFLSDQSIGSILEYQRQADTNFAARSHAGALQANLEYDPTVWH